MDKKYLVFISYKSGDHSNFICRGLKELLVSIGEHLNVTESVSCTDVDDMHNIARLKKKGDDHWIEFDDGSWMTITIA